MRTKTHSARFESAPSIYTYITCVRANVVCNFARKKKKRKLLMHFFLIFCFVGIVSFNVFVVVLSLFYRFLCETRQKNCTQLYIIALTLVTLRLFCQRIGHQHVYQRIIITAVQTLFYHQVVKVAT